MVILCPLVVALCLLLLLGLVWFAVVLTWTTWEPVYFSIPTRAREEPRHDLSINIDATPAWLSFTQNYNGGLLYVWTVLKLLLNVRNQIDLHWRRWKESYVLLLFFVLKHSCCLFWCHCSCSVIFLCLHVSLRGHLLVKARWYLWASGSMPFRLFQYPPPVIIIIHFIYIAHFKNNVISRCFTMLWGENNNNKKLSKEHIE